MFPVLIDFGTHDLPFFGETHLFLPTYGLLFAASVVLAWWWFTRRARTLDIEDEALFNLVFYTLLAGIVGAKVLLIIIDWRFYLRDPVQLLGTLRSAGVLIGGVVAGGITFALYARRKGLPLHSLLDAIAAPLVLAQGIGRLGCFSAGCCWGKPAGDGNPLGITFTDPVAGAQTGVPLHVPLLPTQLIELSVDLLLALVLSLLWRRRLQPAGTVFWLYVLLYSVARGMIEFWRGDVHRGLYFGDRISTSQILALGGVVLALTILARARSAARRTDPA